MLTLKSMYWPHLQLQEVVVDGEKSNVKKRGQDCILISCLYPWKTRIKLSLGWITKAREM
ncbi:hypothetical protein YC2023_089664 [Brassica napus]